MKYLESNNYEGFLITVLALGFIIAVGIGIDLMVQNRKERRRNLALDLNQKKTGRPSPVLHH